jgi:tetratricopeptide (TPR) repeat protein
LAEAIRLLHLIEPKSENYSNDINVLMQLGETRLALGCALLDRQQNPQAEAVLAAALAETDDARLRAALAERLYVAQKRQNRLEAALQSASLLKALDPGRSGLDAGRCDLLADLGRHDEALDLMRERLADDPANAKLHHHYNAMLYQLGRETEMFVSYDKAPPTAELIFSKGSLLMMAGRAAEAHDAFAGLAAREPDNRGAWIATATTLTTLKRHGEAMALLDAMLAKTPQDFRLRAAAANAALYGGDASKAAALLETVVAHAPHDHNSLARLSTAWRLLGDARDETLMEYDGLIAIFDLEPPQGFSSMTDFNAALEAELAALHPPTREFLGQSLRTGTQTSGHLFGGGHALVERLKHRIDDAVARYIAGLRDDPRHPLHGRRGKDFSYAGSWSSRLSDCGFHINHIHPLGWISSCYYVGVPDAVTDEKAMQGWIKFGEPDFESGLPARRAIQPQPGRLVLFPSYMWHGTVPFRSDAKRTTIAFDVAPS